MERDPRIARALDQLATVLVPGERIEAYAVQRRLFALTNRRAIVAATTNRLIMMMRGLVAGFHPQDVRWQDLKDAQLRVGIFGATLTITAYSSPDLASAGENMRVLTFEGLRKEQAQKVYRVCQAQEQAWREKRRVRELEELRAKSGGVHIAPTNTGAPGAVVADQGSGELVARLERAKEMLEKGLISDAEYESIKARIVSGL